MTSGIYRVVTPSGKAYVGSATRFIQRITTHKWHLRKGTHHSPGLQAAYIKYGEAGLKFEILLICDPKDLLFYEQRAIDILKPEYNVAPFAKSRLGTSQKQSAIDAARSKNIGRKWSEESKQRLREAIAKSEARKEAAIKSRGVSRSDEFKHRMSILNIGRKLTPEQRAKISKAHLGRKQSPEIIAKRITPEMIRKIQITRGRRVRCVETGMIFEVVADAGMWCIEQGITYNKSPRNVINKAIRTKTSIYGYHWEVI